MNAILEQVIKARKGHYCHCVEVSNRYELEAIADQICDEFEDTYGKDVVLDFLQSLDVYCLDDSNEAEVFGFSFADYLN